MLLLSLLTGCGWRLRGSINLDIDTPIYVKYERAGAELQRELNQVLTLNDVPLAETPEQAQLVLTIHRETQGRRVLTIDTSGLVNEYELQYSMEYSLRTDQGALVIPNDVISLQRDYSYDANEVLAKGKEEELLFDFMRRMAVQNLLRRVKNAAENHQAAPATETEGVETTPPVDAN